MLALTVADPFRGDRHGQVSDLFSQLAFALFLPFQARIFNGSHRMPTRL